MNLNGHKYKTHRNICGKLNATYQSKNEDYGNSFGDMFQELGPITALTRIGDKYNRLKNLFKPGVERQVSDESIEDTLLDMANYCIMSVIELREGKSKEGCPPTPPPPDTSSEVKDYFIVFGNAEKEQSVPWFKHLIATQRIELSHLDINQWEIKDVETHKVYYAKQGDYICLHHDGSISVADIQPKL